MTYLPESLIQHDSYIYMYITRQSKVYKRRKYIRYLSNGLFTVNPIKLDVIRMHTLLCIGLSVIGLPSKFIGIITVFTFFLNHMQRSLVFFKDSFLLFRQISCKM